MEEFKNNIESFDLLMSTTTSKYSRLINYVQYYIGNTAGIHSHIAICIWGNIFPDDTILSCKDKEYKIEKNELYLFESVFDTKREATDIFGEYFDGVQIRKFDDVYSGYKKLIESKYITQLTLAKITQQNREIIKSYFVDGNKKFLEFINKHIRTDYNFSIIDKLYIPFHDYTIVSKLKNINDYLYTPNNGIICSELMALIFIELKLLKEDTNVKHLMPEQFLHLCDIHIKF